MSRRVYVQEKLKEFSANYGLEFNVRWDRIRQVWIFRFENREFKLGCELNFSDTEIYTANPDYLVGWIIDQVASKTLVF